MLVAVYITCMIISVLSREVMKSSNNKKAKPPKAKPKAPEVKKDLTNVRVIQRKMAYVIGLPLSLADEDVWSSFFVILSIYIISFISFSLLINLFPGFKTK